MDLVDKYFRNANDDDDDDDGFYNDVGQLHTSYNFDNVDFIDYSYMLPSQVSTLFTVLQYIPVWI